MIEMYKEIEKRAFEGGKIVLWSQGNDWVVAYQKQNSKDLYYKHVFSHYRPAFNFYSSIHSERDIEASFHDEV